MAILGTWDQNMFSHLGRHDALEGPGTMGMSSTPTISPQAPPRPVRKNTMLTASTTYGAWATWEGPYLEVKQNRDAYLVVPGRFPCV